MKNQSINDKPSLRAVGAARQRQFLGGLGGLGALLMVGLTSACGSHRASAQHVTEPGLHVVSASGVQTVVWSDGKRQRSCSLRAAEQARRPWGEASGPASCSGGPVDAALFHLCEAHANGDLTDEQYARGVMMTVAHLGSGGSGGCGGGKGHGPKSDGEGMKCPHCRHPKGPPPDAPSGAVPEAVPPVGTAPVPGPAHVH